MRSAPREGLASGVDDGGGSDVNVGGVEADVVELAEADCDGAVAAPDVDGLSWVDAAAALMEGSLPGADVTVLAVG
jgi:hypothetical protein